MDDKKIFKILQYWFPELTQQKIPKKDNRHIFQQFSHWLMIAEENVQSYKYLMHFNGESSDDHQLQHCMILKQLSVDSSIIQQRIQAKIAPLRLHYEKHKDIIGQYYNLNDQIFDLVFEEISALLTLQAHELLIIYAEQIYWMAVPDQQVKIRKFCKYFNKQFKSEGICIEHYTKIDGLRST